jgi:hypothetical protein
MSQEEISQNAEPQLTEIEQKASAEGWVPKDKWEGDPAEWRDAQSFVDRGQLFKKIEDQNRTIKDFKRALAELQTHHAKVREVEYQRALDTLKAQKKQALEDGDADGVVNIDDKIAAVRDAQKQIQNVPQPSTEPAPQFVEWADRNKWYNTDEDARAYADGIGRSLAMKGMSPDDVLKEVEVRVKKNFPQLFRNPNKDKPGAVESSSNRGGKESSSFSLTEEERRVMQRFIRTIPGFDEKAYITELKRVKGV